LNAVAVDGRADRSTWINRHGRNLWPGRFATGLWRVERRVTPTGGFWCCRALRGRSAVLPSTTAHSLAARRYSIRRCCRVAPIRIHPVRRVHRHPVFRMPRYSIGGA